MNKLLIALIAVSSGLHLQAEERKDIEDRPPQQPGGKGVNPAERIFREWDKNRDGVLVKREVPSGPRRIFDKKDTNGDGKITLAEHLGKGGKPPRPRPENPGGGGGTGGGDTGDASFTIQQTWDQEPGGYDRPVYAVEPGSKMSKTPVIIYFHGNGGNAGAQISQWSQVFPDHLVIAPQGYLNSWNVQGEASNAPDVEFFKEIISEMGKRYRYADMENVSLIGSSNGAAYVYRLMIEVEEDLFKNAVPMVSSLLESQHSNDTFWKPSGDTDNYDTQVDPVGGRTILYLHGTEDRTIPFEGGLRGQQFEHHSAYDTAYIWAEEQGYAGPELGPADGRDLGNGLLVHEYEGSNVTFVAVEDGGHSLQPHRDAAIEYVRTFLTQ